MRKHPETVYGLVAMLSRTRRHFGYANVMATVAVFIALGGGSYAALSSSSIPDSLGTFHACVSKRSGKLRLVTRTTACHKGTHGEFAASWNQKGQPGSATGPAGGELTGSYPNPTIAPGAVTDAKVAAANIDGAAGTPSLRRLGTGAQQAAAGNDPRFSSGKVAFLGDLGSPGPGPISIDVTKASSSSALLVSWSGTGYLAAAGKGILCLGLDGVTTSNIVGFTKVYFTNANEHFAFPAKETYVTATAGHHSLWVFGGSSCVDPTYGGTGATVDANDWGNLSVLELTPAS